MFVVQRGDGFRPKARYLQHFEHTRWDLRAHRVVFLDTLVGYKLLQYSSNAFSDAFDVFNLAGVHKVRKIRGKRVNLSGCVTKRAHAEGISSADLKGVSKSLEQFGRSFVEHQVSQFSNRAPSLWRIVSVRPRRCPRKGRTMLSLCVG